MFNAANQRVSMPISAARKAAPASPPAPDRSSVLRFQKPAGGPTAKLYRRAAGEISQPEPTPEESVVVRFFSGRCDVNVDVGSQWVRCGEAVDGMLHASGPNQRVRTEWHSQGEELALTVPHDYWRDRVTDYMRAVLAAGKTRRYGDAMLRQLANMLMQSAPDDVQAPFTVPLIDTMLARLIVSSDRYKGSIANGKHRNALPAFRMQRVADYVRQHLSEPITLADMASAANMSPMHFAALFRGATGQRPHHYLLERRILHAKDLMTTTTLPLCDIALSAGFSTQAHFCTVFKQFAGTTPKQWRMNHMR
jgi:AraC family transcriptional regulator